MWALTGIYIIMVLYPFFDEWRERRSRSSSLVKMRDHVARGHKWDPLRGGWKDN